MESSAKAALDVAAILGRVAELAGASTDTGLAKALGVSQPAVAHWRARGSIPFDRICEFAAEKGASLHYVLLGEGPRTLTDGAIDPLTFTFLASELDRELKKRKLWEKTRPNDRYWYAALLYNKIVYSESDASWEELLGAELDHVLKVLGGAPRMAPGEAIRPGRKGKARA